MNKIVYYVASSLDGYISGENDDISGFVPDGSGVQKYLQDLKDYETVIMGRNTYEFGYLYGLKPGQPAYPHMQHYIFSRNLSFEEADPKVMVRNIDIQEVRRIKEASNTDIYLCGGGQFAGWLLDNELIDVVKLKLNPLILGRGIKLFGESKKKYTLELNDAKVYDKGLIINSYEVLYT